MEIKHKTLKTVPQDLENITVTPFIFRAMSLDTLPSPPRLQGGDSFLPHPGG